MARTLRFLVATLVVTLASFLGAQPLRAQDSGPATGAAALRVDVTAGHTRFPDLSLSLAAYRTDY